MISRGYTWLDDSAEHSDEDSARAAALARKWSQLMTAREEEFFRRQADAEEGRSYEPEPDPCEACGGAGYLGIDGPRNLKWPTDPDMVGIKCPNPHCEDGWDMQPIHKANQRRIDAAADRQLDIELVEAKLALLGARMMRPYEHWNEDEALMAYMERDRD